MSVQAQANYFSCLPKSLSVPFNQALDKSAKFLTNLQKGYNDTSDRVIEYLPKSVQPLAKRISEAVPEILFCACMVTGTYKCLALTLWAVRSIWLLSPLIKCLARGDFTQEALKTASTECLEMAKELFQRFKPAILVSCAIGALFSTIMGVISVTPSLLMHASFLLGVSYLAYRSIQDESGPAQQTTPPPVVPPESAQASSVAAATTTATEAPAVLLSQT